MQLPPFSASPTGLAVSLPAPTTELPPFVLPQLATGPAQPPLLSAPLQPRLALPSAISGPVGLTSLQGDALPVPLAIAATLAAPGVPGILGEPGVPRAAQSQAPAALLQQGDGDDLPHTTDPAPRQEHARLPPTAPSEPPMEEPARGPADPVVAPLLVASCDLPFAEPLPVPSALSQQHSAKPDPVVSEASPGEHQLRPPERHVARSAPASAPTADDPPAQSRRQPVSTSRPSPGAAVPTPVETPAPIAGESLGPEAAAGTHSRPQQPEAIRPRDQERVPEPQVAEARALDPPRQVQGSAPIEEAATDPGPASTPGKQQLDPAVTAPASFQVQGGQPSAAPAARLSGEPDRNGHTEVGGAAQPPVTRPPTGSSPLAPASSGTSLAVERRAPERDEQVSRPVAERSPEIVARPAGGTGAVQPAAPPAFTASTAAAASDILRAAPSGPSDLLDATPSATAQPLPPSASAAPSVLAPAAGAPPIVSDAIAAADRSFSSPTLHFASPRFSADVAVAIARKPGGLAPGDELVLQIAPADMGRISVELRFAPDGALEAVVSADQPRVLDQLRAHGAELHRSLVEAGGRGDIAAPRFEIRADTAPSSSQQGGQGSSQQHLSGDSGGQQHGQPHNPARAGHLYGADTAQPTVTEHPRRMRALGRLDLIA